MTKRLFVGNLSFDVSEAQLQEAFAAYGASAATIPTNDNGRPKGFGFVDVQADQMEAAINGMNGKELGGRAIALNEAKPKPEVNAWGGSGGRGGYGGRGGFGGNRGGFGGNRGGGGGGYGGGGGGGNRW